MDALEQLNLSAPIADTYNAIESEILCRIAEQLSNNPDMLINASSEWRIRMLAEMGRLEKSTAAVIASMVKGVPEDVEGIIQAAVDKVLEDNELSMTESISGNIEKAMDAYDRQAVKDKYNQVNTVMQFKAKQAYVNGVNQVFDRFERIRQKALDSSQKHLDILNKNALAVVIGEKSRTEALRDTIKQMCRKGIPAFVDSKGREWSPEAYVNMDIRNTVKNAANAAEDACMEELGQDVYLVSSHSGARRKCFPHQGKFYSRSGKTGVIHDANGKAYRYYPESTTSIGEPDGLFGINCGHKKRGVSEGMFINREKVYSEKENSEEYEKVCKQRQMERKIRADKRTRDALRAAGDTEGAKELQAKINAESKSLRAYCDKEGLVYRQNRLDTYGYLDKSRTKKAEDFVERVDKTVKSDIINKKISDRIINIHNETDNVFDFVDIENEMMSSPVGKDIAIYIENEGINITVNYDLNVADGLCGEILGKEVTVYGANHRSVKEVVDTIVHEVAHRKYNWNSTQEDEINCRILEILRAKDSISETEISRIVDFVRENYSDIPEGELYGY